MTDNVTPLRPPQSPDPKTDPNADILSRMKGAEAFAVQPMLRWNKGTLEQMWQGSSGTITWHKVPDAKDSTLPIQES